MVPNGDNSMDEAGPTNPPFSNQDMIDEMAEQWTFHNRHGMEIDQSDDSDDESFGIGDDGLVIRPETLPRIFARYPSDYIDEDFMRSDSMYVLVQYVSRPLPLNPIMPNEFEYEPITTGQNINYRRGYYILVTNIVGGWNKNQVEGLFRTHFGVERQRSMINTVALTPADFRMLFKFTCAQAREFAILYLAMNNLQNCFHYIALNKIPDQILESESDDEDDDGGHDYSF